MAAKKKLPPPVLEELVVLDTDPNVALLRKTLVVLKEVYASPTLAIPGWESRRRRAKRPQPNLISDMIRELEAALNG